MEKPKSSFIANRIERVKGVYLEYPSQFWVLILGTFIDRLGGALMFPFFTLYITKKFEVGMTQVGLVFVMFSISTVIGSLFGGALTDRMGRKSMLIFGLITSAFSSILMGVVGTLELFIVVAFFVGLLSNSAGPAQQAMVADILPEEKRAQGYGIIRVVANLSITIGPMIGGFLASRSYLLLFICDAVASLITAGIVYFAIRETLAPRKEGEPQESMAQTIGGYGVALRDVAFAWFLTASMLSVVVYMQMNTTLAVYLRDIHGIAEQGFGYILSLNAGMVVLFQFPITRWISKFRPMMVMTVGTLLYAIGFATYGFVSTFFMFLVAMVIITIGEMFVSPVGQAIVARLAPADMRGRYMATYGFSWIIPSAVAPLLAGLVMDNFDPRWVWWGAGIIGLVATSAYYLLEWRTSSSRYAAVDQRLDIMEQVEQGLLSAEEAAEVLSGVTEGAWVKLAPSQPETSRRYLRIRVNELSSNTIKVDLRLPLGLVNTVLDVQGRLTTSLDGLEEIVIESLQSGVLEQGETLHLEGEGDQQVQLSIEEDE